MNDRTRFFKQTLAKHTSTQKELRTCSAVRRERFAAALACPSHEANNDGATRKKLAQQSMNASVMPAGMSTVIGMERSESILRTFRGGVAGAGSVGAAARAMPAPVSLVAL